MHKKLLILIQTICFILGAIYSLTASAGRATVADRRDVQVFINEMVKQYNFNGPVLNKIFQQVKFQPQLLVTIKRPKEAISWTQYRAFFITAKRINEGVIFWNQHAKELQEAQKEYGVPANIIVSIVGVETNYGTFLGNRRVIDVLSTLAFNPVRRQAYFKRELKEYLILTREQHLNPLVITGSYAGAIGMPQFMPSSYRAFAVDGNADNKIDLIHEHSDVIDSVANYFVKHGWQTNQLVTVPAIVTGDKFEDLPRRGFKPKFTLAQLAQYNVKSTQKISNQNKATLIQLRNPRMSEFWLGFNNFYVITTYNPSANYAMVVYQLSQEIAKKRRLG